MSRSDRLAGIVSEHSKAVVVVLLVATLAVSAGSIHVEESTSFQSVEGQSTVMKKNTYVQQNFGGSENRTAQVLVVTRNESGNALSKESLVRTLRYQQSLRNNDTVNETLVEDAPITSVASIVGQAAVLQERRAKRQAQRQSGGNATAAANVTTPTLDQQIEQLESMSESEVDTLVSNLFRTDTTSPLGQLGLQLLPKDYEPGTATADARMMVVTQRTEVDTTSGATLTDATIDAQVAVREIGETQAGSQDHVVFGKGYVTIEETNSMSDSFAIISPLALIFILVTLLLAYRDLLDIALGFLGIVLVLMWTFGFMGWAGMVFNQMMIAVPVLLIGLSIDYSIHVVMRYREEREADDRSIRDAMRRSVGKVGVALALVTATTAIGFMTNLTSSLPAVQNFGVVSAAGIVSALIVFGAFIPALKVELDSLLAGFGFDRRKRAIGTDGGRLSSVLTLGVRVARRAPVVVLLAVLLVSAASGYAGTQVESSFSEEQFIADDPPEWTESLPGPLAPANYTVKENLHYIESNFQTPDKRTTVLVEGAVTDPKTLDKLDAAAADAAESDTTYVGPGGEPAVSSPVSLAHRIADRNQTVNRTLRAADTDGDGVPDQNVTAVYDSLFGAAPERASQVIYRDDGEYEAVRISISVVGTASPTETASATKDIAATAEYDAVTVTATGGPVVNKEFMERVTSTVAESLALTIGLVFVLLLIAFRLSGRRATLGGLTLVPTLLSVSWIVGTMYLLDIPFSFTTAVIGSISIGLGVDYAIHVTERYSHELTQHSDPWDALTTTISGTGGALLSSAVTTTIGFGVLAFTFLPGLQQFGIIIALSIVYAFFASVFVLPSLLILWTRAIGEQTLTGGSGSVETATAND
ncbi:efflux RND transporter permease subunit [Halorussus caseinilyticus]|uniref:RND family transporter n=1 Tax=Halorussus caseinilyticus TaxID=3034025 RepID=A0ABD5WN72_9EURY|nr:MMPL family transporter [Halorussus sp. DT72]